MCGNQLNSLQVESQEGKAVLIKSPHSCNRKYPKSFMCVYNVNMPCSSVEVSHSNINLLENDFVQVFDSTNSNAYQPVTNSTWPAEQHRFPSSNLKVIFWSDNDSTQGDGFRLQFSCPTEQPDSSGDTVIPQLGTAA